MPSGTHIEHVVKTYLRARSLAGADPSRLTSATPLISSGILDSLATKKLVSFLEDTFAISIRSHEICPDYLDSVARIASLVRIKRDEQAWWRKMTRVAASV